MRIGVKLCIKATNISFQMEIYHHSRICILTSEQPSKFSIHDLRLTVDTQWCQSDICANLPFMNHDRAIDNTMIHQKTRSQEIMQMFLEYIGGDVIHDYLLIVHNVVRNIWVSFLKVGEQMDFLSKYSFTSVWYFQLSPDSSIGDLVTN